MNRLSQARSYLSLGLLKRSSSCHIQCFDSPSKPSAFGLSRVHCYSSKSKKAAKSGTLPLVDKEKDVFFVVRKGDIVGIYKDLSDCQVGSSVYDPPVSVYKGYSLLKNTEEYLSSVGLKNPLYSFRASDLKEDMFASLAPCPFQEPTSCEGKKEDSSEMKSKDKIKDNKNDHQPPLELCSETSEKTCFIEFDGASKGNPGVSGAAAVLKTEDGSLICKVRKGLGMGTNNAAEYQGLILGLKYAIEKGYNKIRVQGDSKLVYMQIKGQWKVKHEVLSKLHKEAKQLTDKCVSFEISHVLRNLNSDADEQANLAVCLPEGEVEVA